MSDIETLQRTINIDRNEIDRLREEIASRERIISKMESQYETTINYKEQISTDFEAYFSELKSKAGDLQTGSIFGTNYISSIESCFGKIDIFEGSDIMLSEIQKAISEQDNSIMQFKKIIAELNEKIKKELAELVQLMDGAIV